MKRYYKKKEFTMIIFMIMIFVFSVFNLNYTLPFFNLVEHTTIEKEIDQTELIINDNVFGKYAFVEAFGYLQNILGKREVNAFEVIKDEDNSLHMQTFQEGPAPIQEVANNSVSMYQYFKEKKMNYMVLLMPDKFIRGKSVIEDGYPYNYANERLDNYSEVLNENQVPYYDIRNLMETSDLSATQLFFNTDHHWRIETAFMAYQNFLDQLKIQYNLDLDPTGFYRNQENYNFITYPSIFLGSLGRKTGSSYAGTDDFTFVYPKFATDFKMTWTLQTSTFTKTGRFEVALANPSYLQHTDVFDAKSDTYAMYLDGNAAFTSIENTQNTGDIKVLFIKDSLSLPFAAFFANTVKQTDLIDPRYYEGDLKEFLMNADYDYVFSSLSASTLQLPYVPSLPIQNTQNIEELL